jgi:hypothetical protein
MASLENLLRHVTFCLFHRSGLVLALVENVIGNRRLYIVLSQHLVDLSSMIGGMCQHVKEYVFDGISKLFTF